MNFKTFPTDYHFDTKVQLARYDFKNKNVSVYGRYESLEKDVNSFSVRDRKFKCEVQLQA